MRLESYCMAGLKFALSVPILALKFRGTLSGSAISDAGSAGSSAGEKIILPESVREQLRQAKGFGRFGTGMIGAR